MEMPCIFSGKLASAYTLHTSYSSPLHEMDENRCTLNKEKVPSSDSDEYEYEYHSFTVVNEHSEILGVVEDSSGDEIIVPNKQEEIYVPPIETSQSDSESVTEENEAGSQDVHDNEDSEDDNYIVLIEEENNTIENNPNSRPQIHIRNYARDVEHEDDFGNGWNWDEKDPGSSCGPYIGQSGLFIEPANRTPEGFFNLLFDKSMWTLIAQQTNIYARQRIQKLRGIIFALLHLLYFFYTKTNVLKCYS